MQIGTGLLLAAIVIVAAWQIDKRQKWRALGKLVASLIVLAVAAGLGMYVYSRHETSTAEAESAEIMRKARLAQIDARNKVVLHGIDGLQGVSLGNTRAEVEYKWGAPTWQDESAFTWDAPNNKRGVRYDSDGKVEVVVCGINERLNSSQCDSVVGVSIGASEADVIAALGNSIKEPIIENRSKILTYGPKGRRLQFVLKQDAVQMMVVSSGNGAKVTDSSNTQSQAAKPAADDKPSSSLPAQREFPIAFRGKWSRSAETCQQKLGDSSRIDVNDDSVSFYESFGKLQTFALDDSGVATVKMQMEGEGEKWNQTMKWNLSDDAQILTDVTSDPSFARIRCD